MRYMYKSARKVMQLGSFPGAGRNLKELGCQECVEGKGRKRLENLK